MKNNKLDKANEILKTLINTHLVIPQHDHWWFKASVKHFNDTGVCSGSFRDAVVLITKEFCRAIIEQETKENEP